MSQNFPVILVLLDFSKAFDILPREELMALMSECALNLCLESMKRINGPKKAF